ncbi:hypothetical protein CA85_10850 [Allorhodopirellula solitaria]|uniref:Uncharacterized protein n=1 Tax=Allorhodopirellula solitaria TaxID=2527987 RepID=A0A5C5YGD3_9BACT|nr:hypothetical protein CA85_10850 [Allorhodopirellula solitaria]
MLYFAIRKTRIPVGRAGSRLKPRRANERVGGATRCLTALRSSLLQADWGSRFVASHQD